MNDWRPALEAALLLALLTAVVLLAARLTGLWLERDEEDEDMHDLPQETHEAALGYELGLPVDSDRTEAGPPVLLGEDHGDGPVWPVRLSEPPGDLADEPSEEDVTEWLHSLHDPIETAYARNHDFLMAARADADYVQAWIKGKGTLTPGRVPIHPGWHETELAAAGLIPARTLGDQVAA